MDLKCIIKQVSVQFKGNFYIVIQYKEQPNNKIYKFRTQIVNGTDKPQFFRNIFQFNNIELNINTSSIKFGLFSTILKQDTNNQKQLLDSSTSIGIASLKFNYNFINQLQQKGFVEHNLTFSLDKKEIGRIYFAFQIINSSPLTLYQHANAKLDQLFYNPFQQDMQIVENNINKIQKILALKNKDYEKLSQKLGTIRSLQQKVLLDEKKLRTNVENLQKSNAQLQRLLKSKIDFQTVKTQIQLLKGTSKGQALLISKLEYIKSRLNQENQEHQELSKKYKLVQPKIKNQISITTRYNQLIRDIKSQQFQIERNQQILRIYNDLVDRIRTNQNTLKQLKLMSSKSDMTAKQALLILEQVRYEKELESHIDEQKQKYDQFALLDKIEALVKDPEVQKNEQQYTFTYEVKLDALKEQIRIIEEKIKKF